MNNANSEFLCNSMYKHLLDLCNEDISRKKIISIFKNKFSNVWLTLYNDVIVANEVNSEAVFISQTGIYRYLYIPEKRYISISEYFKKEYLSMAITMDLYKSTFESYIEDSKNFYLEPLVLYIDDRGESSIEITDRNLSEEYLLSLLDSLNLYHSIITNAKSSISELF